MRRFACAILLFIAAAALSASPYAQAQTKPADANQVFRLLADRYIDDIYFRNNPSLATLAGDHQFDSRLEDFSRGGLDAYLGSLRNFRKELEQVKAAELTGDNQLDLVILRNAVDREIYYREKLQWLQKRPDHYTRVLVQAIYPLLITESIPSKERLASLTARLKQVPRVLAAAEALLVQAPPREPTYSALHNSTFLLALLRKGNLEQFAGVTDEKLQAEFRDSNTQAQNAIEHFIALLTSKGLLPKPGASVGVDALSQLLTFDDMIDVPLPELLKAAEAEVARIDGEMKTIAAKLAPNTPMRDVLRLAAGYHPARPQLESTYAQAFVSSRQFAANKSLVKLPNVPPPAVRPTPDWLYTIASSLPVSTKLNGLQAEAGSPTFFVAFGPTSSPQQLDFELSRHNYGLLTWRTLHDVYPGEHSQRSVAATYSRVRSILGSRVSTEGWNEYSVHLAVDAGYLPPLPGGKATATDLMKYKLSLLDQELLRATLMSTALTANIKDLEYNPATTYFLQHSYVATEAGSYIRTIIEDPLCFAGTLGRLQLLKLKQDYRQAKGPKFSEQEFNDALLRMSGVPIPLIRKALLGDKSGSSL